MSDPRSIAPRVDRRKYDALTLVAESVELQKKYASPCGSTEGYEAENLDGYLLLLKRRIAITAEFELYARLYAIEYMIAIHGIFMSRFLNPSAVLVNHDKRCYSMHG
jgi:hypothetical protein